MLLNRIRDHVDPLLRFNQNGFRQGRGTVGQILALRRLLEGVQARKLPAVLTFVDFRKAFDSIHRVKMCKILSSYGIPEEIVSAISNRAYLSLFMTPPGPGSSLQMGKQTYLISRQVCYRVTHLLHSYSS